MKLGGHRISLTTIYILLGYSTIGLGINTCQDTLTSIRQLVMRENETTLGSSREGDSLNRSERPGKRGAVGPPGPPGPKGDRGDCSCDLGEITAQIQELKDLRDSIKRSPGMCYMGISTGKIKTTQLSASSVYPNPACLVPQGTLNSGSSWCSATNNGNQWLQVDFFAPKTVFGIVTRGRADANQWVTSYRVLYGNSVNSLRYYEENMGPKVFVGNTDRNTIVENFFRSPIVARYVRIQPLTYHDHITMRIEMRQC